MKFLRHGNFNQPGQQFSSGSLPIYRAPIHFLDRNLSNNFQNFENQNFQTNSPDLRIFNSPNFSMTKDYSFESSLNPEAASVMNLEISNIRIFTNCQHIVSQRQIYLHLQWSLQHIVKEYILFHLSKLNQRSQSVQFTNDVTLHDNRVFLREFSMLYGQSMAFIGATFLQTARQS